MPRESYRDRAVVVRTYDFGEADRVIVLLTRHHGLVRGVAKGVRRAKSRFGSRLQQFVALDVQIYPGRGLSTITSADTVAFYGSGIIDDYETYTAGCAVLETAQRLAYEDTAVGEDETYLYDAVVATFAQLQSGSLAAQKNPDGPAFQPTTELDMFCLQAMAHAGWAPSLFNCAACGEPGPHHAFHPVVGGASCVHCRPQGAAEVDPETLHLMWLWAGGHRAAAVQVLSSAPHLAAEAHRLTTAHLQWHLERKITALNVRGHA